MAEVRPIELEPNLFLTDSEEISGKLNQISQLTNNTGLLLRTFENDKKLFAIKCHDRQNLGEKIKTGNKKPKLITPKDQNGEADLCAQRDALIYEINGRTIGLQTTGKDLEDKFKVTVEEISRLQEKLLNDKLTHWKHDQKLWGNGDVLSENLDKLQSWCENLAELIYHNRSQLNTTQALKHNIPSLPSSPSSSDDTISSLQKTVTHLLSTLVKSTFIVENQPPQVLKTKTKFHLIPSVRLLVGRLDIYKNPPKVEVNIISEAQAKVLDQSDGQPLFKACGSLDKNTAIMQYSESTRHLTANFRNIQLTAITRSDRSLCDKDSVMDEKFCLHFNCNFGENELVSKTWTCSLPVVVIVHSTQEPNARATVAWDNAFGERGRIPFEVPPTVAWYRVGQMLSDQFKCVNGRSLTEGQLRFLGEKAFSNLGVPVANDSELKWTTFCKNNLPGRDFTFWEWFYAAMKLTKNYFRDLWGDGSIIGFVNRQEAQEMLSGCQGGTFLLRFSDSEKQGGISITYVEPDGEVVSILPFTKTHLAARSLADRINDLGQLSYLYPDKPKDTAFSKYYSPAVLPRVCDNGYKPFETKTNIPTRSDSLESNTLNSNVSSPHPCMQMDSVSSPSSVFSYPFFINGDNSIGATGGGESTGLNSNDASHHSGMQMDFDSGNLNGDVELLAANFPDLITIENGGILPHSKFQLYPTYSAASPSSHSNASVHGDESLPRFETLTSPFSRSLEDTTFHGANNMGFISFDNSSMSPQPTMQIESNSDPSPGPQSNAPFNGGGSYTILQNVSSSMTDEMSMDIAPIANSYGF